MVERRKKWLWTFFFWMVKEGEFLFFSSFFQCKLGSATTGTKNFSHFFFVFFFTLPCEAEVCDLSSSSVENFRLQSLHLKKGFEHILVSIDWVPKKKKKKRKRKKNQSGCQNRKKKKMKVWLFRWTHSPPISSLSLSLLSPKSTITPQRERENESQQQFLSKYQTVQNT